MEDDTYECPKRTARRHDVSERTLWRKVKEGTFPAPSYYLGPRVPRWPVKDTLRKLGLLDGGNQ